MITSFDILKFIIKSRLVYGRRAKPIYILQNWSYQEILWQVNESIKSGLILVSHNLNNQILGVVLGRRFRSSKPNQIHIVLAVADSLRTLAEIAHGAKERFSSDVVFTAKRHGNFRSWKSQELFSHLN